MKKVTKNNKIQVIDIYSDIMDNVRKIKDISILKLIEIMKLYNVQLLGSYVDYSHPSLYGDIFIFEKDKYLYNVTFSAGMKNIYVNNLYYKAFDNINFVPLKRTVLNYTYDKKLEITKRLSPDIKLTKKFTYQDYLRKNKINKIFGEE